eukprot:61945-Prymnesium_polylepis.2
MARGVGCSKTIVGESVTPVSNRSRDVSSIAANESTPASISGVSAVRSDDGASAISRTISSTDASTWARRRAGTSGASASPHALLLLEAGASDLLTTC